MTTQPYQMPARPQRVRVAEALLNLRMTSATDLEHARGAIEQHLARYLPGEMPTLAEHLADQLRWTPTSPKDPT